MKEKHPERVTTKRERLEVSHMGPFLTVAQTAAQTGLSQATIRAWIAQRRLTYVRLGRAIRIPASVVAELIQRGTIPAREGRHGGH